MKKDAANDGMDIPGDYVAVSQSPGKNAEVAEQTAVYVKFVKRDTN